MSMKLHLPAMVLAVLTLASVGIAAAWYFIRMPDPAGTNALATSARTTVRIGSVEPSQAARSVVSPASAAALAEPASVSASELRLIGVIASSQDAKSVVLLSVANKAAEAVRTGDRVAGWRVGRIKADEVELERGDGVIRVRLSELSAGDTRRAQVSASPLQQPRYDPGPIVTGKPGLD